MPYGPPKPPRTKESHAIQKKKNRALPGKADAATRRILKEIRELKYAARKLTIGDALIARSGTTFDVSDDPKEAKKLTLENVRALSNVYHKLHSAELKAIAIAREAKEATKEDQEELSFAKLFATGKTENETLPKKTDPTKN